MAANIVGYVTVYESSDGGTGDPAKTVWQFFVGHEPVVTTNRLLADTVRLVIDTNSRVQVTYDPMKGNTMSQARIELKFACEMKRLAPCDPGPIPPG